MARGKFSRVLRHRAGVIFAGLMLAGMAAGLAPVTGLAATSNQICGTLFTSPAGDAINTANGSQLSPGNVDNLDVIGAKLVSSTATNFTVEIDIKNLTQTFPQNATFLTWFFQYSWGGADYYVSAEIDQPDPPLTPVYGDGIVTHNGNSNLYGTNANSPGAAVIGSFNPGAPGSIVLTEPLTNAQNGAGPPAIGQTLSNVYVDTYIGQGPIGSGSVTLTDHGPGGPKALTSFGSPFTAGVPCGTPPPPAVPEVPVLPLIPLVGVLAVVTFGASRRRRRTS